MTLELDGVPLGADVRIDGQPTRETHHTLARGSVHRVRVTAPGMTAFEAPIVADRDRLLTVTLVQFYRAFATDDPAWRSSRP